MQRAQNPQQVQAQIQISPEKWMESFNIYYFKNFIFYRKFTEEFYSQIDSMIALISNNINFQLMNNLNQMNIDINELRTDLENKRKLRQDNKDFVNYCTFSYFENFYFFTLFFVSSETERNSALRNVLRRQMERASSTDGTRSICARIAYFRPEGCEAAKNAEFLHAHYQVLHYSPPPQTQQKSPRKVPKRGLFRGDRECSAVRQTSDFRTEHQRLFLQRHHPAT